MADEDKPTRADLIEARQKIKTPTATYSSIRPLKGLGPSNGSSKLWAW